MVNNGIVMEDEVVELDQNEELTEGKELKLKDEEETLAIALCGYCTLQSKLIKVRSGSCAASYTRRGQNTLLLNVLHV